MIFLLKFIILNQFNCKISTAHGALSPLALSPRDDTSLQHCKEFVVLNNFWNLYLSNIFLPKQTKQKKFQKKIKQKKAGSSRAGIRRATTVSAFNSPSKQEESVIFHFFCCT